MARRPIDGPAAVLDLRILIAAGAGWTATAIALSLSARLVAAGSFLGVAAAILLLWRRHRDRPDPRGVEQALGLSAVAVACVLAAVAGHMSVRRAGPVSALAGRHAIVQVTGTVVTDPRQIGTGHGDQTLVMTRLVVHEIVGRGTRTTVSSPVLVFGDRRWLELRWHARVEATIRLGPADPGDDVEATARAQGLPRVLAGPGWLLDRVEAVRSALRAATDDLPTDPRGLVPALVIGDTSRLPGDLDDDMRATGMTHLNAVSGSNVTFVALAATWLCGWIRIPRRGRAPVVLLVLAIFVLLCRPEPSVIRAAVMGVVGLVGLTAARIRAGPPALGAAVILLLMWDPWLARSFGFALSSLATLGLLLFARPWGAAIAARLPIRARPLGEAIAIPIAAQAVCGPVIVLLQNSVSLVGVPANLVAAPFVAPATLAGVVTACVAPVLPGVARPIAWVAALPAWAIAQTAHIAASIPFGTLPWLPGPAGALALCGLTLCLILCGPWMIEAVRRHPLLVAMMGAATLAAWWPIPARTLTGSAVYVACDVGQGDAGILPTGAGHAVVVDVGPDDARIASCLDRLGITEIDVIVLTHFHADHVGGLAGAIRHRRVGAIMVTPVTEGSSGTSRGDAAGEAPLVMRLAQQHGIPVRTVHQGDRLRWGTVSATVLWPTSRTLRAGSIQNNASITLDVRSGGLRLLMMGDLEREGAAAVRRYLLASGGMGAFDVLKVAHHGSANQDPDLVRAVHAPVAVISVGADNDYGHPAPRTLDLLAHAGSTVFRTDRGGPVSVTDREGRPWIGR